LGEVADRRVGSAKDGSSCGLDFSRQDPKKRRLPGAIGANECITITAIDRYAHLAKHGVIGEFVVYSFTG
jgi:hypothetical protein